MNNLGKKVEIFVIVTIIAFIGIIYAFQQKPLPLPANEITADSPATISPDQPITPEPTTPNTQLQINNPQPPPPVVPVTASPIEYQGVDGKNALELLEANHNVQVKHYDFGDMVIAIDGYTPDKDHFWALYIKRGTDDYQMAQVGASSLQTKNSDSIRWQVDTLVNNK